jgi:crotonobetainyl-CoA:carnitine CoA-transferase CaiB-like acyl-CoA transferase
VKDPHIKERGMLVTVDHPLAGKVTTANFPIKFSLTPAEIRTAAPLLGQNTKEILSNLLGYTDEQMQELVNKGVIAPV